MSPIVPARVNSGFAILRRHLAPILLCSGVAVLGYAGFQYGAMLFEQRQLQTLWREQQRLKSENQQALLPASREKGLTRITIPSIGFAAVVVEGTDFTSLMAGPGHLTGTAQPGEPGNAVLSAHRDTFFRDIDDLNRGDRIIVERGGRVFTYEVAGLRIVKANDISVVAPTDDNRLTLVTCDPAYYPGPAPKRLVIVSKLVAPVETSANAAEWIPVHSHLRVKQASTSSRSRRTGQ